MGEKPFGLQNAPPGFQRYINKCLGDYAHKGCEPYLDDVLCFSPSFDEHLRHIQGVLQRSKEKGVKLHADKCSLFKNEVRYLGRLISKNGYRCDPIDTAALEKFRAPPKAVGELRSLLGFFGYYRCYVRDFSKIMSPLYSLLKLNNSTRTSSSGDKSSDKRQYHRYYPKTISWNKRLQQIVDGTLDYLKSRKEHSQILKFHFCEL